MGQIQKSFQTEIETPRVAVFVDGENIGHGFEAAIHRALVGKGRHVVRRVYGNAAQLVAWEKSGRFAVRHTCIGKNSADLQISVDAMDLSYRGLVDHFVFVSSDVDFVAVAENLRERGFPVTGVGKASANLRLKRVFCEFVELTEPVVARVYADWEQTLRVLVGESPKGMKMVEVNSMMHKLHQVKIAEQPEKTWRGYFVARPAVFRCDPKGPEARVRLCSGA